MEEATHGGGWIHEDSSHNILTLDALQVLSRSQVTPELSMSMRIRPICKSLHTLRYHRKAAVTLSMLPRKACSRKICNTTIVRDEVCL
jgi:hypothetical protein